MRLSRLPVLLLAAFLPVLSHATHEHPGYLQGWADVEVYDRTDQRTLAVHEHDGRRYIAGEPGHQYELRIRNRSGERLLAVVSVDGVNVITGETAGQQQSGYVLDGWHGVDIDGWRKSLDDIATFYFTRLSRSYAARTGRPHDVGVIGVALFREHRACCRNHPMNERSNALPESPRARAEADQAEDSAAVMQQQAREKLGTGHGHRESSPARYVDFRRASSTPEQTIVIYYDSRKNLVAQGVIRKHRWYADKRPQPFPKGFVPDP
jgi:hypothetical protein